MDQLKANIHGASALHDTDDTPVGAITIFEPVPQLESEDELRALYANDAKELATVLVGCLPQGTLDQLLILLLEDRASLMRVVAPNRRRRDT